MTAELDRAACAAIRGLLGPALDLTVFGLPLREIVVPAHTAVAYRDDGLYLLTAYSPDMPAGEPVGRRRLLALPQAEGTLLFSGAIETASRDLDLSFTLVISAWFSSFDPTDAGGADVEAARRRAENILSGLADSFNFRVCRTGSSVRAFPRVWLERDVRAGRLRQGIYELRLRTRAG